MIIPSRLLRLSLGVSVCVAATSVAAQAIAPETTASSATEAGAQQQDPAPIASFEQWLADFRQRALAAGIETSTLDNAFAGVTPDPSVQALNQQQPEFTRYLWEYLDAHVTPSAIQEGQQLLISQHALFQKLRQQYGVDPGILTAIWSMESGYGKQIGNFYVIRSLATLAHEGRRTTYGNTQLLAALQILQTEKSIDRSQLVGSWAGAMGQTQFIPSTYRDYAVDEDGDQKRDVWNSNADALGSAANYLKQSNWTSAVPWDQEVHLSAGFDYAQADLTIKKTVAEWQRLGVAPRKPIAPALAQRQASVLLPTGYRGPAFPVFDNFRSILRYNNSTAYALAVGLLADGYAGEAGVEQPWPKDDPPLNRTAQITELQQRLTDKGFDVGGVDGVLGARTRQGIRAFQRSQQLPQDGYASTALLARLRAA
ncbi:MULTISPECIES: lytic murein transglycosylase [Xanthomonas]|uniref:lytic murein transglycosylase n=1 Tax=Xanthomonas TaxID=338 RepID=UPI0004A7A593|nr:MULTISPECIES: lytic murein transglycosylase [Xanthomonas]MEB1153331.1 lytic murein transglycosylase [Xanthomonas campestris pv. campestris]AZU17697.1 murein transglycosylase [Xanthomonas citri pv. fuscans]AZU21743.1 murein transglycosylase [Xanthomonas citri pv. fuscans]AZU92960.1 murein transglycosylase [Xanthomonas citri pv. fuscans]KKY06171.1 murein transglycosylase [Xanthomonas phaseoli pv. phaseoli]